MSIITYPLNNVEYDASDAETYLCTRTSGIYSSDAHFAISIASARQVSISPGLAWINNADFKGKSVASTGVETIDIDAADGELSRKDLIVLRFDATSNSSYFAVKSSELASAPIAPAVERTESLYELGLYLIDIPAGSTSITVANITSVVLDEAYCGVMRDGVTHIPTAQLQAQYIATLEELKKLYDESYIANLAAGKLDATKEAVESVLTGDISTHKHSQYLTSSDISGKLDKTGGTLTGAVTAHTGTDYTTYRVRNIAIKTAAETPANGNLLAVYSA